MSSPHPTTQPARCDHLVVRAGVTWNRLVGQPGWLTDDADHDVDVAAATFDLPVLEEAA